MWQWTVYHRPLLPFSLTDWYWDWYCRAHSYFVLVLFSPYEMNFDAACVSAVGRILGE